MKMNNVHIAITHYISEPFSESFIKKEVPEKTHTIHYSISLSFLMTVVSLISLITNNPSLFITHPNIILDYFIYLSQKLLTHWNTKISIKLDTIKRADFVTSDNGSCSFG